MLTIGALSRATGMPVETLRTWEQRYGFPSAARKPSGLRVYPVGVVSRLRRMADALARGHRAGEVVPASDEDLVRLLAATASGPIAPPAPRSAGRRAARHPGDAARRAARDRPPDGGPGVRRRRLAGDVPRHRRSAARDRHRRA
jgi:hypothetical protein